MGWATSATTQSLSRATAGSMNARRAPTSGWSDSDKGDEQRGSIIAWLRDANSDEGWFSWAEVVLGDDDREALVERHAWDGG